MTRPPWENEDGSTNVDGFLAAYGEDNNTFWRAEQGHIMNVLDDLIDTLGQLAIMGRVSPTPENVECPECDVLIEEAMQWRDWQSLDMGVYCDKHTPGNVEEPT